MSSRVIEALRQATGLRHQKVGENPAMTRLFDSDYTVSEYRSHLGRLLGLFEPLERAIGIAAGTNLIPHMAPRSHALHADLLAMGATERGIASLELYRGFESINPAGLQGCVYVILGSMLGAKIIVKQLRSVLGSQASYQFYGDADGQNAQRWKAFCLDLETAPVRDIDSICATAITVFDAYQEWLSEPLETHSTLVRPALLPNAT